MRLATLGYCCLLAGCSKIAVHAKKLPFVPLPKAAEPAVAVIVPSRDASRGSPIQLGTIDGRTFAWIADADADALQVVDLDALAVVSTVALGGSPSELVMLEDGSIVAALRSTNELVRTSPGANPVVRARIPIASEPVGLARSEGSSILVTSAWARTLTSVSVSVDRFSSDWTVPLGREPRTVIASGTHAFVSHAVGDAIDVVDLAEHSVKSRAIRGRREGGAETTGHPAQGFALAKSASGTIYAPRALAQTARQTDFGWGMMRLPAPAFMDEEGNLVRAKPAPVPETSDAYGGAIDSFDPETLDVAVLDAEGEPDLESLALRSNFGVPSCALPRSALVTPHGRLVLACIGINRVVELDAGVPSPHHALIRSTNVSAGPTGLAWDEKNSTTVVWSQFARQIALVPESDLPDFTALAAVTMPAIERDDRIARGRVLFHATNDKRISKDGRACASCHPDGREDGLVWQTKDGPRQTMMLAGRVGGTAPYGWLGQSKSIAEHLEKRTFKRLGGTGLPAEDLDALVAYVESLSTPSPIAAKADLVTEGEALFNGSAQCANCHGSDGRSPDGLDHSVWSRASNDATGLFDTPSLAHVGQTAPYFHDGRYATLRELLEKVDGTMGHTKQLGASEMDALEAFLVTR